MNAPALRTADLAKTFRDTSGNPVHALRGIDLRIGSGEIIGLLGPNGAGKSTLVDLLLGLTQPTAGTVEVFGGTPRTAVAAGRVGAVLQTGGLLPDLTVRNTVRMIAATHAHPLPVDEVLAQADLTHLSNRRVAQCSGGEQQRLRFALAILSDPDLLVLDEPTTGMDAGARHAFWESMRHQADQGRTILFATHYIEEAQDFAERIVMIGAGRVLADGPTEEIRMRAAARKVSATLPADVELAEAPGVLQVSRTGGRTEFSATDSDALARWLLTRTDARDLEISAASLEDAFLSLTRTSAVDDAHDVAPTR